VPKAATYAALNRADPEGEHRPSSPATRWPSGAAIGYGLAVLVGADRCAGLAVVVLGMPVSATTRSRNTDICRRGWLLALGSGTRTSR
jgi:hypothetical protein